MQIVQVSFDSAPHLSLTAGPFLTMKAAEDWKAEFLTQSGQQGWQIIPNVTTMMRNPGDGFLSRMRHLETTQMASVQIKAFDETTDLGVFANLLHNAIRAMPSRR